MFEDAGFPMHTRHLVALLVTATALPLAAAPASADLGRPHCGTPELLPQLRHRRLAAPAQAPLHGGKLVRDYFGDNFNVRESENFAVKWSPMASVSEEVAQQMLDALELGWTMYADTLQMDLPPGADTYKLNAYISAGEEDNPSINFDGGYAWVDDEGYAYFVISEGAFDFGAETVEDVAVHELFHDFQFGAGAFSWGNGQEWFWEATAEWGAQETVPDHWGPYQFVGGFAIQPFLAAYHYVYVISDDPAEVRQGYHQYGASIFMRFLTEATGDPQIIADAWRTGSEVGDALTTLDGLLPEGAFEGGIEGAFGEFAAHNARWDYAMHDAILDGIGLFESAYPGFDDVLATVPAAGTDGMVSVLANKQPRNFGYNVIEFERPDSGQLTIELAANVQGTLGSPATWHVTLVRDDGEPSYTPVPLTTGTATIELDLPAAEPAVWLAIGVTTAGRNSEERFPYQYAAAPDGEDPNPEPEPEPEPEDEDEPGCCSASGGGASGSAGLALLVVLAFGRRRRRGAMS
jgi:uncharacterized protein (TIGR03382 family)